MNNDPSEGLIWDYAPPRRRQAVWEKARAGAAETLGRQAIETHAAAALGEPERPPLYTIPEDATSNWRGIVQECLDHYGLTLPDVIKPKNRAPAAIRCGQEIAYRLRTYGRRFGRPMSALDIGKILKRDHSTIFHSVKVHGARLAAARPQFKPEDADE